MTLLLSPATALQEDMPIAAREIVLSILEAALSAVDPGKAIHRALGLCGNTLQVGARSYDLSSYEHIYVVGAGKASAAMAAALEDILGPRVSAVSV